MDTMEMLRLKIERLSETIEILMSENDALKEELETAQDELGKVNEYAYMMEYDDPKPRG